MAFLAGTGASVDKLIPLRHKGKLHHAMVNWWNSLDSTPVPDYLRVLSYWLASKFEMILRRGPLRAIILIAAISWLLLDCQIFLLGRVRAKVPTQGVISLKVAEEVLKRNVTPDNWIEASSLPHISNNIATLPFDFLVVGLTFGTLRILRTCSSFQACIVISAHIVMICVLGVGCYAVNDFAGNFALNHNTIGLRYARRVLEVHEILLFNFESMHRSNGVPAVVTQLQGTNSTTYTNLPSGFTISSNATVVYYRIGDSLVGDLKRTPDFLWGLTQGRPSALMTPMTAGFVDGNTIFFWSHLTGYYAPVTSLLCTGTLAIPTLFVTMLLAFMLVARLVLSGVRALLMYYFDLATEKTPKEFMPGTLFGIAIGLLIALLKLLSEGLSLIHIK